jgi:hypothetical protein
MSMSAEKIFVASSSGEVDGVKDFDMPAPNRRGRDMVFR